MAKRFKYRLERVLQYREHVRDERRRELLIANRELRQGEQRVSELQEALSQNVVASGGETSAGAIYLAGAYAARLKELIERQLAKNADMQKEVAQALERYIEASKDSEALKILKRKKFEEYRAYIDREEAKFLDELTTQRYTGSNLKE